MCKSLELINKGGEIRVSSRVIAIDFEKEHKNIKRDIQNLVGSNLSVSRMFLKSNYIDSCNRDQEEYFMNRDGFSLLVMGFTGQKALEWKLKYIQAFNEMEKQLQNPYDKLSPELKAIFELDTKQQQLEEEVKELKEDMPLFNIECEELQEVVRKTGIKCLGGKNSKAYKDNSLRGRVYKDIQRELKRQFGVHKYKAIKRKQLDVAKEIISSYKLPILLQDEISLLNSQIGL